ncbi:hypothetical protein [Streptomyces canus]|uniref:hypothetical protein n=1 Tax=Streptomyces canus TaxID=58343 RepID=UPI00386FDD3D|nr:hypothetical protein OH824_14175 [Streptomyces canus]
MSVPERYQRYAQPVGHLPVQPAEIQLYDEADPIVHVPDPYNPNGSIAVRRSALHPATPTPPRDLTPQPLLDPTAQRYVGAGIGGGVLLWGGGQFLIGAGHLISSLSGVGALLFFLMLAGARTVLGGRQAGTRIEVHNHARGFGRNTTNL